MTVVDLLLLPGRPDGASAEGNHLIDPPRLFGPNSEYACLEVHHWCQLMPRHCAKCSPNSPEVEEWP